MLNTKIPNAKIYLSRRNLLTLLSKLDRAAAGEDTSCTIIKYRGEDSEYRQTISAIKVIGVEDSVYYKSQDRLPGEMHPKEEFYIVNAV